METIMDLKKATAEELTAREQLLVSEIEGNEEENATFQEELNSIYAEQDRRRD